MVFKAPSYNKLLSIKLSTKATRAASWILPVKEAQEYKKAQKIFLFLFP